jgi:hypothetical protein
MKSERKNKKKTKQNQWTQKKRGTSIREPKHASVGWLNFIFQKEQKNKIEEGACFFVSMKIKLHKNKINKIKIISKPRTNPS